MEPFPGGTHMQQRGVAQQSLVYSMKPVGLTGMARQFELGLETKWVVHDPYFRMITTLFGVCVIDSWKGYSWNVSKRHKDKSIGIRSFANIMAKDMLENAFSALRSEDAAITLPLL
eukprot:12665633-Ditylum_brightwellii.AAC.1